MFWPIVICVVFGAICFIADYNFRKAKKGDKHNDK